MAGIWCSLADGSKAVSDFLYKFLLAATGWHIPPTGWQEFSVDWRLQFGSSSCAMKRPIKFSGGFTRGWKAKRKATTNDAILYLFDDI